MNRRDPTGARDSNVIGVVPFSETYKAEFSSAASAGHMTTSSRMVDEQATFRTGSDAGTCRNLVDDDFLSNMKDLDSRVLSVTSSVPAASWISAVPLSLARPAEIVRCASSFTARRASQTYVTCVERDAPCHTPGTLMVAKPLTNVILCNILLDLSSGCAVEASHMTNKEKVPDFLAVWIRTRKTTSSFLYFAATICFH